MVSYAAPTPLASLFDDTLAVPSERQCIENMHMTANALSVPARVMGRIIAEICSSSETMQKTCDIAAQGIKQVVDIVVTPEIQQRLDDMKVNLQQKHERKYGIPQQDTAYFCDSLDILATSFASGGITGGIKIGAKELIERLKSLKNTARSIKIDMNLNGRPGYLEVSYVKTHNTFKVFVDMLMTQVFDPYRNLWVDAKLGTRTSTSGFMIRAFQEIKHFAETQNAKELQLQFIPANHRLYDVVAKRFEYLGCQPCFTRMSIAEWPVFKIKLAPKQSFSKAPFSPLVGGIVGSAVASSKPYMYARMPKAAVPTSIIESSRHVLPHALAPQFSRRKVSPNTPPQNTSTPPIDSTRELNVSQQALHRPIKKDHQSFAVSILAPSLTLLAVNFLRNPKEFIKGIKGLPEQIVNEIGELFGIKKKKSEEDQCIRPSIGQLEIVGEKISQMILTSYMLAQKQWMIHPDMFIEDYTNILFFDWRVAVLEKGWQLDFTEFVSNIQKELEAGHFSKVHEMSSSAHLKTQAPPQRVVSAFVNLEGESIKLASSSEELSEEARLEKAESDKLNEKFVALGETTEELSHLVDALAANPDKLANLRARIRERQAGLV